MSSRKLIRALALVGLGLGSSQATADAQPGGAFDYSIPFGLYGVTQNFSCPASPGGVCGAIAAINSFIYLGTRYPGIYGRSLTPNYDPATNTDPVDATAFANDYYGRPAANRQQGQQNYLNAKMDWIGARAPGTTVFDAWFPGSTLNDRAPTILDLANEIRDGEDVEFFVTDATGAFYHALTLTAVACDMVMSCTIGYQDPNAPTVSQAGVPVTSVGGMLQFTGVPGSNFAGTVSIVAAFAESPVPEPGTWILLGTGLVLLVGAGWRRRAPDAA